MHDKEAVIEYGKRVLGMKNASGVTATDVLNALCEKYPALIDCALDMVKEALARE